MSIYASIVAYTNGVQRAIRAYREDQLAAEGTCVTCGERKRHGERRQCYHCLTKAQRPEVGK